MLSFRDLLCFNAISVLSRFTHFCVDRKWTQHSCLWSKYDVWVFCVGRITFKNIFTLWTLLGRNIFALFCCRDLPESSSESFLLQGCAWKFFWWWSPTGSHCSQPLPGFGNNTGITCAIVPFSSHLKPGIWYFESNGSLEGQTWNTRHQHCNVWTSLIITSVIMFRLVGFEMGLMLICLFLNNPEAQVH